MGYMPLYLPGLLANNVQFNVLLPLRKVLPTWGKLVFDSSSHSSYMRSSFPKKFPHLKPFFFNLAFMPSLYVGLVKAVMRGSIITLFFNNFQSSFSASSLLALPNLLG